MQKQHQENQTVVAGAAVVVVSATTGVSSAGPGASVVAGAWGSATARATSGTGGTSSGSILGASLADLLFFRKRLSFFGRGEVGLLLELDGSSSVSDLTSEGFLSFLPREKKLDRRLASFCEEASATFSSESLMASPSFTASVSSGLVSVTSSFYNMTLASVIEDDLGD